MKINDLEKYLVENDIDDVRYIEVVESIKDKFEYDYDSPRKLTDEEEIDYEYYNDDIMEFIEFMKSSTGINDTEEQYECSCEKHCDCYHDEHYHQEHYRHYHKVETEEEKFFRDMRAVHIMAMYLLRDGIHYADLVQDGIVGLVNANNLYKEDAVKLEKNKNYFIAKEMINHIKNQLMYRKTAFVQYVKEEKNKEIKMKLSPKVRLKDRDEEVKRAEAEKKEEHRKEIARLEETTKSMFDYFKMKYRLSLREIESLSLYFGLDGNGKKNFIDIEKILGIKLEEVEKLLREGIFKLSVVNEKVEI